LAAAAHLTGIVAMASFNRVILVGNLTRDPELRYIPSGTAVSEIGLAVNDRVKRNDQWVDETTFVDVTMWGRTAEVANEYLSKGAPVLIEGRLKLDTWEKEGQKRSKLKVVCERMQMLGSREGGGGGGARGGAQRSSGGGRSSNSGGGSEGSYDDNYDSAPSSASAPSPAGFPPDEIPF
jgi:single-strand DNA-binding protein